jgi:hypothetical protein
MTRQNGNKTKHDDNIRDTWIIYMRSILPIMPETKIPIDEINECQWVLM